MTNPPVRSFDDSDYHILLTLVERYGLSIVVSVLGRICFRQAEHSEVVALSREAVNEWRKDASLLTKVLLQLKH